MYLARSSGEVGLMVATSNAGFGAGVCDAAGITAIPNISIRARRLIVPQSCVTTLTLK